MAIEQFMNQYSILLTLTRRLNGLAQGRLRRCATGALVISGTVEIEARPHSVDQTAEQYIQVLLGIPAHIRVEAIIAIGYPAETKAPVPEDQLDYGKIRFNGYAK